MAPIPPVQRADSDPLTLGEYERAYLDGKQIILGREGDRADKEHQVADDTKKVQEDSPGGVNGPKTLIVQRI